MKLSGLTKTVLLLGVVSLFADISSEMLYPVTPIFLTSVLGASMLNVGLIEGLAEFTASLVKGLAGRLSDRWRKRKVFVWVGYLLAAFSKPFIGTAFHWEQVLFARSADRLGKGLRGAPRDAWLADSIAPALRGAAFGWHRAMDNLGAFLGPLLALGLLSLLHNDLRRIYWIALIPGLLAVLFVFLAPEKEKALAETMPIAAPAKAASLEEPFSKSFKYYVLVWGIFSLTNSSDAFLLLKAQKAGHSLQMTILLYCGYNLVTSLLSAPLGHLSDRWQRKHLLSGGLLLFALVYLGFAEATELWHYAALFALYGCYAAATDGVGKALAVDLLPSTQKASGLGFLAMVSGLGTLFASIVAGGLWDHFGAGACFLYGGAGALIGALLLLSLENPRTERQAVQ